MGLSTFFGSLRLDEWILLFVSITALLPAFPLFRLYIKTKIGEYILFSTVFFISSIFSITFVIANQTNLLIYWQISFTARNLTYFLFFVHTIRMLWRRPPILILYPGVLIYGIIQFLILLWQSNPAGIGAGIYTQDKPIFATDFRLIANVFQLYVAIMFFYGYYQIKLINPSREMKISKTIMLGLSLVLTGSRLLRLLQNFGLPNSEGTDLLGAAILIIGFIFIGFVFIKFPSSMMLSRVQMGAIMVLSDNGLPISSIKFKEAEIKVSATLLGGIITAIDSVVGTIGGSNFDQNLREVGAKDRSILIHQESKIVFSILTNTEATALLRSSLQFFAREYVKNHKLELEKFRTNGKQIEDISDELTIAFPYATGLTLENW